MEMVHLEDMEYPLMEPKLPFEWLLRQKHAQAEVWH